MAFWLGADYFKVSYIGKSQNPWQLQRQTPAFQFFFYFPDLILKGKVLRVN